MFFFILFIGKKEGEESQIGGGVYCRCLLVTWDVCPGKFNN